MAALNLEFLLQAQGVQTYRHAQRQDGSKLHSYDLRLRRGNKFPVNLNRP